MPIARVARSSRNRILGVGKLQNSRRRTNSEIDRKTAQNPKTCKAVDHDMKMKLMHVVAEEGRHRNQNKHLSRDRMLLTLLRIGSVDELLVPFRK